MMMNKFKIVIEAGIAEGRTIFHDRGVMLIFIIAGLLYPILYNIIYYNDVVKETPIAVVDNSASFESRRFLKELDATSELKITEHCMSLEQAQELMSRQKVNGIVFIPADYQDCLANKQQATISTYADMSSFLYYKNMALGTNFVMLDLVNKIQQERYEQLGYVGEQGLQLTNALPYEENSSYNPGSGFASFFLPAILILILHQTMFFGICMVAGTAREEKRNNLLLNKSLRGDGVGAALIGKSLCYVLLYSVMVAYALGLIPMLFNMPQIGNIWDVYKLMLPFVLACVFFSLTISTMIRNRETSLVVFLFFTLILLFLSGFSWPQSNIPTFWKYVSYLFPSTFGIQGYIKINSAGAEMSALNFEYIGLWIQTGFYFITACVANRRRQIVENSND